MKKISKRAILALILGAILLAGVAWFTVQYVLHGSRWATFSGNPHVYTEHGLPAGEVTDRSGTALLTMGDDRSYAESGEVRRATVHLLGDRNGNIPATVTSKYINEFVGFGVVNGLYDTEVGGTMQLTVSAPVEKAAWRALNGRRGLVMVYNYQTGEILCSVSSPSCDPDNSDETPQDGSYVNRTFQSTYTPGSIFKLVTAAAALETLPDAAEKTFRCDGSYTIGDDVVTCQGVHGDVNLQEALAMSCNCYFGQLAQLLGRDVLTDAVNRWGVTKPCTFDGITTAEGHFDVAEASECQLAWSGIGQHTDLVNPCSYLQFVGSIAGQGKAAVPYLVQSVGKYRAETSTVSTMEPKTAAVMTENMAYDVTHVYGTAAFPNVTVCAKSGTAEVGEGLQPHATFTGFIADEEYPLAFIVVVENGGSGSAVGVPIAGSVLRACVDILDAEKNN